MSIRHRFRKHFDRFGGSHNLELYDGESLEDISIQIERDTDDFPAVSENDYETHSPDPESGHESHARANQ